MKLYTLYALYGFSLILKSLFLMDQFNQIRPTSLREQVVRQIRNAIIEGRLNPGDHITESSLTEQLSISRTPVRESLILLEREGLVVSEPNRGSYVRAFTPEDVTAIFTMRATLETAAAEACIHHLTDAHYAQLDELIEVQKRCIADGNSQEVRSVDMQFHRYLIGQSQNPLLERFWSEIVAQIAALLYLRAEAIPDFNEYLAISDHTSIVFAYRKADLDELRQVNKRINERVAEECRMAVSKLVG